MVMKCLRRFDNLQSILYSQGGSRPGPSICFYLPSSQGGYSTLDGDDFSNRWCKRENVGNGRLTFLKLLILVFHFTLVIHIFCPLNLNLLFVILNEVSRIFI